MNKTSQRPGPTRGGVKPGEPARSSVIGPTIVVAVLIIGAAAGYKAFKSSPAPEPAPAPPPVAQELPKLRRANSPLMDASIGSGYNPAPVRHTHVASDPSPPQVSLGEPTAASRQLVAALAGLNLKAPLTPEDAQRWKDNLKELVKGGATSVAGIREYLAQNQDMNLSVIGAADQLGYPSVRQGLIDALNQIGGPEAQTAMLQTLQTSSLPSDIGALAKDLEAQAPGQYSDQILAAARAALATAAEAPGAGTGAASTAGIDVGALFKILTDAAQHGQDIGPDLKQFGSTWSYYTAIAAAGLPDGAGVGPLAQIAQGTSGGNQVVAAEALAQLAGQNNPTALNSIMDMVKDGKLSDQVLARMAPFLAGQQYQLPGTGDPANIQNSQGFHINNGNQNFQAYTPPQTPDQMNQDLQTIDNLLQKMPEADV